MGARACRCGASFAAPTPGCGGVLREAHKTAGPIHAWLFPTGKFKNARIAPHNRRPKMAINKRRFLREATYARRCLRGRSCVRGRVVPLPPPSLGKSFGHGYARPQAPSNAKKIPPSGFYATAALVSDSDTGAISPAGPRNHQGRPQRPPPPGRFCLSHPLPGGRSGPRSCQGDRRGHRRRADSVALPLSGGRSSPRSHRGDHRVPPLPGRSACPTPHQEAAAGPGSCQGDR